MAELPQPVLYAILGLLGLLIAAMVWYGTKPLPALPRWLARSLLLLAIAVPFVLTQVVPLQDAVRKEKAEEQARDARVRADEQRRIAELKRQKAEETRKREQEALQREEAARQSLEALGRGRSDESTEVGPDGDARSAVRSDGNSDARSPGAATRGASSRSAAAAQGDKYDVVPVFFGTDRDRTSEDLQRATYGAERAKRLEMGRALVTVPKIHEVPQIERPWVYRLPFSSVVLYQEDEDPAKHFTLRQVRVLTQNQLLAVIKERLRNSSSFKEHALVFVHGFNTSFDYALYRTAQIAYDLKFDGAPFVYSWPSKGSVTSYSYDRESAEQAEPYLKQFLEMVVKSSGAKSVSVVAHSMGNQVLLPVLRSMRGSMPEGVKLSQVILAAPDVDRDGFEFLARQIQGVSAGVTLYAHANDRALEISRTFWGGVPRAGDVPEAGPVIVNGVDTIDVTEVSTDVFALNHSGYAENKALLNDIQLLIQTGERPPEKRIPILKRVTTDRGDYWKYPPQ